MGQVAPRLPGEHGAVDMRAEGHVVEAFFGFDAPAAAVAAIGGVVRLIENVREEVGDRFLLQRLWLVPVRKPWFRKQSTVQILV